MSCNGCRVLRKGCSESCVLRPCLQWIQTPEAQGHATVFVAKFFGRAGLMSFISNVPDSQRPALFQSLLCEACGRTVNPVSGAVGLLWMGNWQICQAAVDTVLRGGTLKPVPDFLNGPLPDSREWRDAHQELNSSQPLVKHRSPPNSHLDFIPNFPASESAPTKKLWQPSTPSFNSEESGTTISFEAGECPETPVTEPKLLNLFV